MPPTRASEGETDRYSQWRLALLALVGVLAAALIGAGSSWVTTLIDNRDQAAQDQASFLRNQREATWSKVAADIVLDQQAQFDTASLLGTTAGRRPSSAFVREANKDLLHEATIGDELSREEDAMAIVSPAGLANDAQAIWNALSASSDSLGRYAQAAVNNEPSTARLAKKFWATFGRAEPERKHLIAEMRAALGT